MKSKKCLQIGIVIIALALIGNWSFALQDNPIHLQLIKLESADAKARESAKAALALRGPAILDELFPRMVYGNATKQLWIKLTIKEIVHNAAAPNADALDRRLAEQSLIKVLEDPWRLEQKQLALDLIALIGRDESVPVLVACMKDKSLAEHARRTLENIPGKAATSALLKVLSKTDCDNCRAAILNSLGGREDSRAISAIVRAMDDPSGQVRMAAIRAAGRIPHTKTAKALFDVFENGSQEELAIASNGLLRIAEDWVECGELEKAVRIYSTFYETAEAPVWRCAGLSGIGTIGDEDSVHTLLAALSDSDTRIQGVAVDRLQDIPGEWVTLAIANQLNGTSTSNQIHLVKLIRFRKDPAAAVALPALLACVQNEDDALREEAKKALAAIPGTEVSKQILQAAQKEGNSSKALAALLWALGERCENGIVPQALKWAEEGEPILRISALETLGKLAEPQAMRVIIKSLGEKNNIDIQQTACRASIPVATALKKAGKTRQAIRLCSRASRHASDTELLKSIADLLITLGAEDRVANMARGSGYIADWYIAAPIPDSDALQNTECVATDGPVDTSKPVVFKGESHSWEKQSIADPLGYVELNKITNDYGNKGAYLYSEVENKKEARDVILKIGSNDHAYIWLNGELVYSFTRGRPWSPDEDQANARLKEGKNTFLVKILNLGGGWGVSLRVTDKNGRPALDNGPFFSK